jgi:LPS export ABC transporter protein LptC
MTLYSDQKDSKPWDISADHGRLLPKVQLREEIIELWDHVVAIQETGIGDFINIQTISLTVYPEKDYAETDQIVEIINNSGHTVAGGMQVYFEQGRFIFYAHNNQRVHTILPATSE